MCSTDKFMNCCCTAKTATICIAVWNIITWIFAAIGLIFVGVTSGQSLSNSPIKERTEGLEILIIIGGVVAFLLCIVNIIMLWAAIKRRPSYLRIWIFITAVAEVALFVIRHITTPTSWILGETLSRTIVEIVILRVVYVYEQSLRRTRARGEEEPGEACAM